MDPKENENEKDERLTSLLQSAIGRIESRIERLEEHASVSRSQNGTSSPFRPTVFGYDRAANRFGPPTSTVTGPRPRFFRPPMRTASAILAQPHITQPVQRTEAIANDFRKAFPSMAGGGRRDVCPPKKRQKTQYAFVKPRETWTHDFCLLSSKNDSKTPTLSHLLELKEAGLGKRRISFDDKRSSHGKVRQVLETIYPKLRSQNGAFEMLRGERGGVKCNMNLIEMSPQGYTVLI
eukprot:gene18570-20432_t